MNLIQLSEVVKRIESLLAVALARTLRSALDDER